MDGADPDRHLAPALGLDATGQSQPNSCLAPTRYPGDLSGTTAITQGLLAGQPAHRSVRGRCAHAAGSHGGAPSPTLQKKFPSSSAPWRVAHACCYCCCFLLRPLRLVRPGRGVHRHERPSPWPQPAGQPTQQRRAVAVSGTVSIAAVVPRHGIGSLLTLAAEPPWGLGLPCQPWPLNFSSAMGGGRG